MYEIRLDHELSKDLFEDTSKEVRDWVVNAIAGIVVADGIVEKHEFAALQEAIGLLDHREEIHNLMKMVKEKKLFEIERIAMTIGLAAKVLFYLAATAVIDGNLKKVEAETVKKCGKYLGLSDDVIRTVMRWAMSQMELNKKWSKEQKQLNLERQRIIDAATVL